MIDVPRVDISRRDKFVFCQHAERSRANVRRSPEGAGPC
jgi:hypothetical protein